MSPTTTLPPPLEPMEHRVLGMGVVYLDPQSNAAPGTFGGCARSLCRRGLLRATWLMLDLDVRCEVTPAGRDAYVSYGPPYVPITTSARERVNA